MGPSYPAPGGPASRVWFLPGPAFYFGSANEPVPGPGRLLGAGRQCFVRQWTTKQNSGSTKPFLGPVKTAGNLRWLQVHPTKRRGRKGPGQGTVMIKAFSAIAAAAFIA